MSRHQPERRNIADAVTWTPAQNPVGYNATYRLETDGGHDLRIEIPLPDGRRYEVVVEVKLVDDA